jgi:hypothetical protein
MNDWKLPDFTKRRILAKMPTLKVAPSHVIRRIEGKMRRYLREWDRHESRYVYPTVKEIRGKVFLIPDRRHHKSKGKPKRDAVRAYIAGLISIYKDATGENLGRINIRRRRDPSRPANRLFFVYERKTIPFLAVCVKAVGMHYPSRIIQEVLEELHTPPRV